MPNSPNFIDRNLKLSILIVFLILFAPLMIREWISLRAEGLYNVEWHTTSMARLLEADLGGVKRLPEILADLQDDRTFADFDQHVRGKLGHLGLLDVKILDPSGEVVYAIDKDLIGKIFLTSEERDSALAGQISSELVDREDYFSQYALDAPSALAEVYVPILSPTGTVPYVMEAYYDYSPIILRNNVLLIKSASTLLVTTLLVMGFLIYLYRGRQKMSRHVEALEAILPICMHCKKVHIQPEDQPDEWMEIEAYFSRQDDLAFSHGICNDCLQKHYPDSRAAQKVSSLG